MEVEEWKETEAERLKREEVQGMLKKMRTQRRLKAMIHGTEAKQVRRERCIPQMSLVCYQMSHDSHGTESKLVQRAVYSVK